MHLYRTGFDVILQNNTNNSVTTNAPEVISGGSKESIGITIIIVCVLVVLSLTGVTVFIMYRYRNR